MKYDELTLMQFADGELNEALTAEIENARSHDKELQSYLEVYETTRSALIESTQEETIPSHINDLIDNFSPAKKQNLFAKIVKNNPFKATIFSAIIASFVTFQGLLIGTGSMVTVTQFARGLQPSPDFQRVTQNVNNDESVLRSASAVNILSKNQIEGGINNALSVNQNVPSVVVKVGNVMKTLTFLKRFTDVSGNNCKVGQIDDQFLIICKTDNSGWIIKSY
jgi:hypothetical protein